MNVPTSAMAAYAVLLHLADDEAHARRALDMIATEPVPWGFDAQLTQLRNAVNQTRQESRP